MVAIGLVIVVVGAMANVLAVFGLRERGEKERLAAQASERRRRRLGDERVRPAARSGG